MTRTPEQAIAAARRQSASGPRFKADECLFRTRDLFDIGAHDFTPGNGRVPWAIEAWDHAKFKHPETNPARIPRGVTVFWRKPGGGPGHVALSAGSGRCWSTDIRRTGYFDLVPIDEISSKWNMQLLGWTEDLNNVRYTTRLTRGARIDQAIRSLEAGLAHAVATKATPRARRIETALAPLYAIRQDARP